jgi:hypothetical protein
MTLNSRILRSVFIAPAVVGIFASAPAQAQVPYVLKPLTPKTRVTFDGYYAHFRLDARGDDRIGMDGMGARIMWRPTMMADDTPILPSRIAFGLFAEYAPEQATGFSVAHAGLQGDLHVLESPLYGRVIPVVSLGAGALWARNAPGTAPTASNKPASLLRSSTAAFPLATSNATTFAVSPAVGVRVGLWRQLGLRADARDVVTFRDGTLHNLQFAAGLSYPF